MNGSTHRRISIASAAILGAALAAGSVAVAVGQSPSAPSASVAPESAVPATLSVEGAWARVSPMMDRAGAAYMVIRNSGITEDALVAVSSPAAAIVELHETVANASGEMMMQPVVAVPVPAGGMAELKPGSFHIMLIDLLEPLTEGATIDLTLTFQSGTVMTVTAPVQSGMPMGSGMPAGSSAPMGSAVPMGSPTP